MLDGVVRDLGPIATIEWGDGMLAVTWHDGVHPVESGLGLVSGREGLRGAGKQLHEEGLGHLLRYRAGRPRA